MHRLLAPADYRPMPWKNGGGRTTEIAADPPGAGARRLRLARVSLADVERDGPFSRFPGIDRTHRAARGATACGSTDARGMPSSCAVPYEPWLRRRRPIDCRLVAGPVRDFNLMVRRGAARGDVTVVRDGGARVRAGARHRLCWTAAGAVECLVRRPSRRSRWRRAMRCRRGRGRRGGADVACIRSPARCRSRWWRAIDAAARSQ